MRLRSLSVRRSLRFLPHDGCLFARVVSLFLVAVACLALFSIAARSQDPSQLKPQGYVDDFAGILSASGRDQLTALCSEVDQKAHAQIAVVTVKSLGGRAIEDYSIDLATRWGVGPKQKDRGILILLAVDDHKDRIEVGYGLEGILPDGKVGSFEREAVPLLRAGNYDSALMLMTRRVAETIAADSHVTLSEQPLPPEESNPPAKETGSSNHDFTVFAIIILLIILFRLIAAAFRGGGRRSHWGGGGGWWIGPMLGGGFGGRGWGGGGFGGGFGGGGSSGGGFGGFGGGSFGGGGASGSW
ncbi:MAG TPA: TPM domain-containing protein [Candidatus Limnocylindrales bacterium]|nr:TPM domain-containing protein [Candidatus Limnocylindrales bacterium]